LTQFFQQIYSSTVPNHFVYINIKLLKHLPIYLHHNFIMFGSSSDEASRINRLSRTAETLVQNQEAMMNNLSNFKSMASTVSTSAISMTSPNYGMQNALPSAYYQSVPAGIFKPSFTNNHPSAPPPPSTNYQPPGTYNFPHHNSGDLSSIITFLEKSIITQGELIQGFVQEIRDLQQYTRKNSLLVHGLELPSEKDDMQGFKFADFVCDKLNKMFTASETMSDAAKERCAKVQNLVGPLNSRRDIDATHVLPTKSKKKDKKTVVVVKFVSRLVRNEFFYN